jgi:hypothetical protein
MMMVLDEALERDGWEIWKGEWVDYAFGND